MFGPRELDIKNTYNPNLQDIRESSLRTYGEANSFYRKEELYMKDVERRILSKELSKEEDIYDECHAIASDLAKCCEMYLKAIYIFEHNIPGNKIDDIWEKLKNQEYKTDSNGNLIYITSFGVYTFVKYDLNGEPIKDKDGKLVYFDADNNTYNENNRGSKIKRSGHQLDRLIELLSPSSNLLLETRMLTIPMGSTENNSSISILDLLLEKGVLQRDNQISEEEYTSWILKHKKTFEEARYSGQKQYDVNVEFLYHLATQIRAVAQFIIEPKNEQKFSITDDEISKLPNEIKQFISFHSHLMSEELIKLIANNEEAKNKIITLFSNKYVLPQTISSIDFYKMIKLMSNQEILYCSYLYYMLSNYDTLTLESFDDEIKKEEKKILEIAEIFKLLGMSPSQTIKFIIQLKETFKDKITIGNESFWKLFKVLRNKFNYKIYNYNIVRNKLNHYPDYDINNDKFKF